MYDLMIIGGGPAGLTAAVYAIRKRLNVLLLSRDLGGKTNYHLSLPWLDDYQIIRGLELVNKFRNELDYLGFAHQIDTAKTVKKINDHFVVETEGGVKLEAMAVIIATGTRQVRLNIPGEKEFIMKGLCYSALSYAPLFIAKNVIVIGNEYLALRSTAELATIAKHVYLVCANTPEPKSALWGRLQAAPNVTILKGFEPIEVRGGQFADTLVVRDPSGNIADYHADGIFVENALTPQSGMVKGLANLDEQGSIIIDSYNCTNVPGLFAAGDVTNGFTEQVLIAIGEGAKASLRAYEYLLPMLSLQVAETP